MKLGEYLIKNSLTHQEFAERVGLSIHAIRKYISGAREVPRKWVVLAIEKETRGKVAPDDWYR